MALSSAPATQIPPPRRLIPLSSDTLSAELFPLLNACNALLVSMPPHKQVFDYLQDYSLSVASAECELLHHNLSTCIDMPSFDYSALVSTEQREALLYQHWCHSLPSKLQFSHIKYLNSLATGGDGALRTTSAYLASHDGLTRLPMTPWRLAYQRITELPTLLNNYAFGDGLQAAVRVLALVNNAHAFVDGNGRLGRFLFNYCLRLSGMPATSYLPLKSLAVLSHGGYEIRLREVELFGHWDGLVTYHCHALHLAHRWGKPIATRDNESGNTNVQ